MRTIETQKVAEVLEQRRKNLKHLVCTLVAEVLETDEPRVRAELLTARDALERAYLCLTKPDVKFIGDVGAYAPGSK